MFGRTRKRLAILEEHVRQADEVMCVLLDHVERLDEFCDYPYRHSFTGLNGIERMEPLQDVHDVIEDHTPATLTLPSSST